MSSSSPAENPAPISQPEVAKPAATAEESLHSILRAFDLRIQSIRRCATEHIQHARDAAKRFTEELNESLRVFQQQINAGNLPTVQLDMRAIIADLNYHIREPQHAILSQSLLIFGFSAFDAFLGQFLTRLYRVSPKLVHQLSEKPIKVSDFVRCKTIEEAVVEMIDRDISSLLRDSYDDVFSAIANRFGFKTIKDFKNWPNFIEASQRRNLVTHCNGVVNSEYIKACSAAGWSNPAGLEVGAELKVDDAYVQAALQIILEVGIKLAHTLWRKTIPKKMDSWEKLLTNEIFHILEREEWEFAAIIGDFAVNLKPKNTKNSDLQLKLQRMNYAQALKWSGRDAEALKELEEIDLSASTRDLRLAVDVLRGNYDNAAKLMLDIGRSGEQVLELGYRQWPIFREFRKTPQFLSTFKAIYGVEYAPAESIMSQGLLFQKLGNQVGQGESKMPAEKPIEETQIELPPATSQGDAA